MAQISVEKLMEQSGVRFGTSGARGLASDMTDFVCYIYTCGFLQYLEQQGEICKQTPRLPIAIGGDLRPSTPKIMEAVRRACWDMGYEPLNCGEIPSPAIAYYGIEKRIPAIMVTGSHIPADRNGIKFNRSSGEILKEDEVGIRNQVVRYKAELFDKHGEFREKVDQPWPVQHEAIDLYQRRYTTFWSRNALKGIKVLVYQHSAVGRDILVQVLSALGAEVVPVGRSNTFVPVDTEAIRPEDIELAMKWAETYTMHAIVSTDGDSDRPLIADEKGEWLRGDVAGILCAKYLCADSVSTPVSCNTAVEKCGFFKEVRRTKIGSPYVIASMMEASKAGMNMVVGYEANGGFLTNSDWKKGRKILKALPTRDPLILIISILHLAKKRKKNISYLVQELPQRYTASDRLKDFPQEKSQIILSWFSSGNFLQDKSKIEEIFGDLCGEVAHIDRTDGIRVVFQNQEIIHLRPSGNAPEFRCYNEAASPTRAKKLNELCLQRLRKLSETIHSN